MPTPRKFNDTEKWCSCCATMKLHSEFHKDPKRLSGLRVRCKQCSKERRIKDRKEGKYNLTGYNRFRRYGLTPEDYSKMYAEQNGKCAMPSCSGNAEFIDHDHETNIVRRLLCRFCNSGLGFFKDNPQLLREALKYLEDFGRS